MIHLRLRIVFDLSLIDVALHGLSVIHLSLHIWRRIEHQEVLVINICDKKLVHNAAQEGGKARGGKARSGSNGGCCCHRGRGAQC